VGSAQQSALHDRLQRATIDDRAASAEASSSLCCIRADHYRGTLRRRGSATCDRALSASSFRSRERRGQLLLEPRSPDRCSLGLFQRCADKRKLLFAPDEPRCCASNPRPRRCSFRRESAIAAASRMYAQAIRQPIGARPLLRASLISATVAATGVPRWPNGQSDLCCHARRSELLAGTEVAFHAHNESLRMQRLRSAERA